MFRSPIYHIGTILKLSVLLFGVFLVGSTSSISGEFQSSFTYHNNIGERSSGREVYLFSGRFNSDHPELNGFVTPSPLLQDESDDSRWDSSEGSDSDDDSDSSSESSDNSDSNDTSVSSSDDDSSSDSDDEERIVQAQEQVKELNKQIHKEKESLRHIQGQKLKQSKFTDKEEYFLECQKRNKKIDHLEESIKLLTDDKKYWKNRASLNSKELKIQKKSENEGYAHDTDCAVLLSGVTLGAAPKTPIIGINNLNEISKTDLFPIVCITESFASIFGYDSKERLHVTLKGKRHLITQTNAFQYLELASRGALIIEAMYNGAENVELEKRYAMDLGILSHEINTKTPGAMILVGATQCEKEDASESICSLTLPSNYDGYGSLVMALGNTKTSHLWNPKTNELEIYSPSSGASLAVTIVTAAAARIAKVCPELTSKQIREVILSSTRKTDSKSGCALNQEFGQGVLDMQSSLSAAFEGINKK